MKKILTVLLLLTMFRLSASTIIINSRIDGDTDPSSHETAGYIEDGLADTLFDRGFIMFSTFNASGYRVEGANDARYMITIEPDSSDSSVSWKLNATVNGQLIGEGKIAFDSVPGSDGMARKRVYYLIGQAVAAKVCLFF